MPAKVDWRGEAPPSDEAQDPTEPERAAGKDDADLFDYLILVLLIVLVAASPIPLGSVAPWTRAAVFGIALTVFILWVLQGAWHGRLQVVRSWVWGFMLAFLALCAFQALPLSPRTLAALSPATLETYQRAMGELGGAGLPLTFFPYGTRAELYRLLAFAMVFFVTVNVVRTPWQALALALAVTSVGALEGLYGFVKLLSGKQRWPLTGTFVNKNHFCGLLEMSLFVTLGLALSLAAPAHRLGSLRARLMARFSSAGTHQVLILCALAMVIGLAILFSLSRAGIACAFVSLIGFAIALGLSAGFRRHILLLSLVGMAVLLMATLAGTGVVAEKMGEALPGRALSWTDRLALSRSGVAHFQSFPVFGTGLGSFRFAFERFQSSRFGDRMVDYLHNDWIQVFCETGAVGGSLVAMGLLVFLWGTARTAASRRDRLCRWLSVGALAGVSSMLLHSLFDFNLTKITCNGILFALIAGLGFAAARMPSGEPGSEDRRKLLTISLGPPLVRMLLAIVVTGAGALSLAWPVRSGLAHYCLNEFLAGSKLWEVDRYFVPVPKWTPNATTEALLFQAQEWDDGNPQGHWFGAHFYAAKANELTRRTAKEAARRILGPESVVANAQAYEELVDVLARNLATQPSRSRARLLGESERMARLSMQRAPISSEHQLYIGWLLSTRAKAESLPEDEAAEMRREAMAHAERAVWLSPAKPHILYHAGRIFLDHAERSHDERARQSALSYLRRAVSADPAYAQYVYPLVRALSSEAGGVTAVTPRSLGAYRRLAEELWNAGEWEELLACLNVMEELCDQTAVMEDVSPWSLAARRSSATGEADAEDPMRFLEQPEATMYTARQVADWKLSAIERRCAVLALLGRWDERQKAVEQHRRDLRTRLAGNLRAAQRKLVNRQYTAARDDLRSILQQDWSNPEALVTAAQVSLANRQLSVEPYWDGALDLMYRLVIYSESLSPDVFERMGQIVGQANAKPGAEEVLSEFIRGAGAIRAGQSQEGIARLLALAERKDQAAMVWRQRHLIWHYLGLGYERIGEREKAVEAYGRVLVILPTHRPTLLRLRELAPSPDLEDRMGALTPEVTCNVNFGGRVSLLGYTLGRESVPVSVGGITVREEMAFVMHFWQFHERMGRDCRPSAAFCGENWRAIRLKGQDAASGGRPYPVDFPRCGEVLVRRHYLPIGVAAARYLRFHIGTVATQGGSPHSVPPSADSGSPHIYALLPSDWPSEGVGNSSPR